MQNDVLTWLDVSCLRWLEQFMQMHSQVRNRIANQGIVCVGGARAAELLMLLLLLACWSCSY